MKNKWLIEKYVVDHSSTVSNRPRMETVDLGREVADILEVLNERRTLAVGDAVLISKTQALRVKDKIYNLVKNEVVFVMQRLLFETNLYNQMIGE